MSLINKMLRDLDARHAATGQTVLPDEVRPLPEEVVAPRVSRRVWILAGLAILGAAAIQTSALWLPLLAEIVPLPAGILPPPAPTVVAQAVPPAPTTVVLQLPPPEQMLPLPSLPETAPAVAEATAEQAPPPAPAVQQAPVPVAENRNTDLKIDRSLPEMPQPKPAATKPAPVVAAPPPPPKQAAPATKSARASAPVAVEKQQNLGSAQERAEAGYRKGVAAYKLGHFSEAATLFKAALQEDPRHLATRQTLLSMQAEQKQWEEVQVVLKEGLDLMPEQISWAMALARIQVERGRLPEAWETLQKHMAHGEKSADYQGFAGVLLQRMQKPHEATLYYQAAVQLKPNEGRWWLGLGLAYEADGKSSEAREAFQRARNSSGVTPEMASAIDKKLR
ncbi:MAG: tetratricopeptide repeat protein [Proteobacteria bacterium]|nr:tetratricopeptide repeat protein [Pseudomonadota bacterium]